MALNLKELKTPSGYLKLTHTVLGAISLGIFSYYSSSVRNPPKDIVVIPNEIFFFLLVSFAFLIPSFLLLVSFVLEDTVASMRGSYFEILYHGFAFIFYFAASVAMTVFLTETKPEGRNNTTFALIVVAVACAGVNSFAYAANCVVAYILRRK